MADSKPIPLRLRPILLHYVDELVKTGAYGKDRSAVMRRFIENGIVSALQGGVLDRKHIADFPDSSETESEGVD